MSSITRRCFVEGAAVTAAATIAAPAVVPAIAQAEEAQAASAAQPGVLNPQDWDYMSDSGDHSAILSSWKIGSHELSHRMVKSAAGSSPWPTAPTIVDYYRDFARGGIELMWCEDFGDMYEHFPIGWHQPKEVCEPTLTAIVEAVHAEGALIGYQLSTMGASFSGFDAATAAEYECAVAGDLTHDEVVQLQADYVSAAKYCQSLGFDGIEINAAGNNLGQSFMSRMRNHRDDEYGPQSFENRARFISGIIEGVKAECGPDFLVQVLINAIEENDNIVGDDSLMTTVEENVEMCKYFEAAGADSMHVRLGPLYMHVCQFASDLYFSGYGIEGTTAFGTRYDFSQHWQGKLRANHSGCGMLLGVAREYKQALSIPVGTVTYMDPAHAPDLFEAAIADGDVDFLLMNRPLTIDPQYVNKFREGRLDEIAPCCRCMHCHFDVDREGNQSFHCRVNAATSRAYTEEMPEGYEVPALAGDPKKVMVIGGGPAGMEAARVAALRGHSVTLYEKSGFLGGMLPFASTVKGPHENLDQLNAYLQRQLEVQGVTVVTGTEVTAETIAAEMPQVVIQATGGVRPACTLEGTEATPVMGIDQIVGAQIGERVCILGCNCQAVDLAMYLQAQGKKVFMVFPDGRDALGKGQSQWVKTFTQPAMFANGCRVWPEGEVVAVGEGTVTINGQTGVNITVACDAVIDASDMLADTSLVDGLTDCEAYAVGDCESPWNIQYAIAAANLVGRKI